MRIQDTDRAARAARNLRDALATHDFSAIQVQQLVVAAMPAIIAATAADPLPGSPFPGEPS